MKDFFNKYIRKMPPAPLAPLEPDVEANSASEVPLKYSFSYTFESRHKQFYLPILVQAGTIEFTNKTDLKQNLIQVFSDYQSKNSSLNKSIKFTLRKSDSKPPEFVYKILRDLISQNRDIQEIILKAKLSSVQNSELKTSCSKNAQDSQARNSKMRSLFLWGSLGGFFNAIQIASTFPVIVAKAVFEGVILSTVVYLRQWYLDSAAKHYTRKTNLDNPSEKAALQLGIKAESWLGYFISYFKYATYRHPRAFAAGLQHAMDKNEDVVDHILGRKPHHEKVNALKISLMQQKSWISFFFSPTIVTQWIAFDDAVDFERQLQVLMDNYKNKTSFLNRNAFLSLPTFTGILPEFVKSGLEKSVSRQGFISNVDDQIETFTSEELEKLSDEVKRRSYQSKIHLATGLGMAVVGSLLFQAALPVLALNSLIAFFATKYYSSLRQQYLDYAADTYGTKESIDAITNPAEKDALVEGLKAGTWKGYLLSFDPRKIAALRHPVAFAAGMEHAVEQNEKMVANIR